MFSLYKENANVISTKIIINANNCLEQIIPMMNEIADISIEYIKYTLDL